METLSQICLLSKFSHCINILPYYSGYAGCQHLMVSLCKATRQCWLKNKNAFKKSVTNKSLRLIVKSEEDLQTFRTIIETEQIPDCKEIEVCWWEELHPEALQEFIEQVKSKIRGCQVKFSLDYSKIITQYHKYSILKTTEYLPNFIKAVPQARNNLKVEVVGERYASLGALKWSLKHLLSKYNGDEEKEGVHEESKLSADNQLTFVTLCADIPQECNHLNLLDSFNINSETSCPFQSVKIVSIEFGERIFNACHLTLSNSLLIWYDPSKKEYICFKAREIEIGFKDRKYLYSKEGFLYFEKLSFCRIETTEITEKFNDLKGIFKTTRESYSAKLEYMIPNDSMACLPEHCLEEINLVHKENPYIPNLSCPRVTARISYNFRKRECKLILDYLRMLPKSTFLTVVVYMMGPCRYSWVLDTLKEVFKVKALKEVKYIRYCDAFNFSKGIEFKPVILKPNSKELKLLEEILESKFEKFDDETCFKIQEEKEPTELEKLIQKPKLPRKK
ncbi:unnamed protein product [Moneuplotes crassus]|uniref:Uncharacterized protein n=1 Tax=Euplotes crassus TaxID=5936 RepID=A0AAD1Y7A3_EUPCR|nr:unnamed protein product [Moneuplotes crassus]